jgi:hypothetical protein
MDLLDLIIQADNDGLLTDNEVSDIISFIFRTHSVAHLQHIFVVFGWPGNKVIFFLKFDLLFFLQGGPVVNFVHFVARVLL